MTPKAVADNGLAVLVVIAATAALAAIATGMSLAAAAASGAASYRAHELQAETIARGSLADLEAAFASRAVGVPPVGSPVRSVNGAGLGGAPGQIPSPGSWWPAATADFDPVAGTRGVVIEIERVVGPDGAGRGPGGRTDPDPLLRVRIEAWFRSARVQRETLFVVTPVGVRRLE